MMTRKLAMLLLIPSMLAAGAASAHKPSDSYLTLHIATPPRAEAHAGLADGAAPGGTIIDGRWDIALRDLDFALGLDTDGDRQLTWDEVRSRHGEIAGYALSRLQLAPGCQLRVIGHQVDRHTDGAYAVLLLRGECRPGAAFSFDYRLFAGLDAQHRGLASITADGRTYSAVLGGEHTRLVVNGSRGSANSGASAAGDGNGGSSGVVAEGAAEAAVVGDNGGGAWRQAADYLRLGTWHIWTGYDHILFLLSLLLPAVLAAGWRTATADVLRVVTAFTLAHSITLSVAALQVASLPSRLVETAIAASVAVAAMNNLWPRVRGKRWLAAFLFGLLHGFGFAGVLGDLGLPKTATVTALAAFNIGVELGQLAIVAAFVPMAYAVRRTWLYQQAMVKGGSACIALLAMAWMMERATA